MFFQFNLLDYCVIEIFFSDIHKISFTLITTYAITKKKKKENILVCIVLIKFRVTTINKTDLTIKVVTGGNMFRTFIEAVVII